MIFYLVLLGLAWGTPQTGAEWLSAIDEVATGSKDASLHLSVDVIAKSGAVVSREMDIWQKGDDQRRVSITAPARLAGTGLLLTGESELHLYMPAYGRVRRIIGDHRGDAFMGTDFTMDDLARVTYADEWDARVGPRQGDRQLLYLSAKDPKTQGDDKMTLWVREDTMWVVRIDHLDASDQVVRRVTLNDFKVVSGRPMAHQISVEDLARHRKSVATVSSVLIDSGLDDDLFTLTRLSGK